MSASEDLILFVSTRTTCEATFQEISQKEIIELGFGLLDINTGRKHEPLSMFIKTVDKKISKYCKQLTGITQKDSDEGVSFDEALSYFKECYEPSSYRFWGTYGNFTKEIIEHYLLNMKKLIWTPPKTHVNIQKEFTKTILKSEIGCSMKAALGHLGMKNIDNKSCEDEILNMGILYTEILRQKGNLK